MEKWCPLIWIASCRYFQSNAVLKRLETPCSISEFVSPNSHQVKTQTQLSSAHRLSSKRSNMGKSREEHEDEPDRFPVYTTNLL